MNEDDGKSVPFVEDSTEQSTGKAALSQPTMGSVVEDSSKTSEGATLQTEGHCMHTGDADSIDYGNKIGSGSDSANCGENLPLASESNTERETANSLTRRLPMGYRTREEAEEALVCLLRSPYETPETNEVVPHIDRRAFEAVQEQLFSGAYSTCFQPDTSIAEVYDDLIRQAKRLRNPLNDLHMLLLERQAEILQLRMTTVSSLMEFQSITSSIKDRIRESQESPPSSADDVLEPAPADSVGNDQFSDPKLNLPDRPYRPDDDPRTLYRRDRSDSFDRIEHALSMSMYTINEESSNENDESSGWRTEQSQTSQPFGSSSSEDESSSPPHDRWGEVSFKNPLAGTSPGMDIRRRGYHRQGDVDANYDWLLLQLQRSSDLSGQRQRLTRWQSFPQWTPSTIQERLRKSIIFRNILGLQSSNDDMNLTPPTKSLLATTAEAFNVEVDDGAIQPQR